MGLPSLDVVPHDAKAFVASSALMVSTVESVKMLQAAGLLGVVASRKLMHMAAGPVFMITWPWFSAGKWSHWCAAAVPACMTLKFALVGLGLLESEHDVRTMSRSGDRTELLRGPLLYGLVFVLVTGLCFRDIVGAIALIALCFGDGMSDVIGRRWGHLGRLPWSRRKSWAGSAGFVGSAFATSMICAAAFHRCGWSPSSSMELSGSILVAVVAGALAESCPMPDVDNVLVPAATAAVLAFLTR
jgi:dolichol kinase